MRVKIGDRIYNTEDEPIMLIFDDAEQRERVAKHIKNMCPTCLRYATFPDTDEWLRDDHANAHAFMEIPEDRK